MSLAHGLLAARSPQAHDGDTVALPSGTITIERQNHKRTDPAANLEDAVGALLSGSPPPPLPPVYQGIRAACLESDAGAARVAARATACAAASVDALAAQLTARDSADWVEKLVSLWQEHTGRIAAADYLLLSLRNSEWFRAHGTPLEDASFARLASRIATEHVTLIKGVCALTAAVRRGQANEAVLHSALRIGRRMGLATQIDHALRADAETVLTGIIKDAYSGPVSIGAVATAFDRERELAAWIYSSNEAQIEATAMAAVLLVDDHTQELVDSIPRVWGTGDFFTVYNLLERHRDSVRDAVATHISEKGREIMANDKDLIESLLGLQRNVHAVLGVVNDSEMAQKVRTSFGEFVNSRGNVVATELARFLDAKLRAGNTAMSDAELNAYMDDALALFRVIRDKDIFEAVFIRTFARRILLRRSASADSERAMLERLRSEYGPDFSARLETMLRDIEMSEDLMSAYPARRVKTQTGSFTLDISVLTQAHWPTFRETPVVVPREIGSELSRFEAFYHTRHSGRTLHWRHGLGSCVLTARLGKAGTFELQVSTTQAIVLLLFNDAKMLTYKDIAQATSLGASLLTEPAELKRTLQSLASGTIPTRVLRKSPQGRDVAETDSFVVNENLQNPRRRIRINQIQMQDTRVLIDRDLVLQAAAMRVLKARKTIRHAELATEVVAQTHNRCVDADSFSVDAGELKKAFERLIEKDLMERVEGERGMYRYVA